MRQAAPGVLSTMRAPRAGCGRAQVERHHRDIVEALHLEVLRLEILKGRCGPAGCRTDLREHHLERALDLLPAPDSRRERARRRGWRMEHGGLGLEAVEEGRHVEVVEGGEEPLHRGIDTGIARLRGSRGGRERQQDEREGGTAWHGAMVTQIIERCACSQSIRWTSHAQAAAIQYVRVDHRGAHVQRVQAVPARCGYRSRPRAGAWRTSGGVGPS